MSLCLPKLLSLTTKIQANAFEEEVIGKLAPCNWLFGDRVRKCLSALLRFKRSLNCERLSHQTKSQQTDCSFELNSGLFSVVVLALLWVFFSFP